MRLLDTKTKRFHWVDDPRTVSYAILSHVWDKSSDGSPLEQTYRDLLAIQADYPDGPVDDARLSKKIRMFCGVAYRDGYRYAWLDSGCIDQSSSAELSEAINSMYDWYRHAAVCYAYLGDIGRNQGSIPSKPFDKSVWFERGWTLQELIAPNVVIFCSADWGVIGTKHSLAKVISEATRIDVAILTHSQRLESVSVARRMSWAARRKTTKVEDEAYSLMGIFGVHMPTVYGEGSYAFFRLQEEICRQIPDQTIFAWGNMLGRQLDRFTFSAPHPARPRSPPRRDSSRAEVAESNKRYLFANSPKAFRSNSRLVPISQNELAQRLGKKDVNYPMYTTTPYGLRTRLPLVIASTDRIASPAHLAFLACQDEKGQVVALVLRAPNQATRAEYSVGAVQKEDILPTDPQRAQQDVFMLISHYFRTVALSPEELSDAIKHIVRSDIYIPSRPSHAISEAELDRHAHSLFVSKSPTSVALAPWSRTVLDKEGYNVETLQGFPGPRSSSDIFTLSPGVASLDVRISLDKTAPITLRVGHCNCQYGQEHGFLSVAVVSQAEGPPFGIQRATSADHSIDFRDHIAYWPRHAGSAFREIKPSGVSQGTTLRLTFSRGHASVGLPATRSPDLVLSMEVQEANFGARPTIGEGYILRREVPEAATADQATAVSGLDGDTADGDSKDPGKSTLWGFLKSFIIAK